MPTSTGADSEAEIVSIEKQLPEEPVSGWAAVTDRADWRSVKTGSHCRKIRWTFGSNSRGTRLPASATRTQDGLTGLVAEGIAHWNTPAGSCATDTSAVPPRAPDGMSTRQLPSFATVASTERGAKPRDSRV